MQRASPRAGQRATHPDWCLHRNPAFDAHGGRGRAQRHAAPPLTLTYADRSGLELPDLPSPGMRWWAWRGTRLELDRQSRTAAHLRQLAASMGFRCDARWSVAQLCESLPQRLLQEFIEPPVRIGTQHPAHEASAEVFCACCATACSAGAVARTCCCCAPTWGRCSRIPPRSGCKPGSGAAHGATRSGLARTLTAGTWTAHALTRWCWPPTARKQPAWCKRPTAAFPKPNKAKPPSGSM